MKEAPKISRAAIIAIIGLTILAITFFAGVYTYERLQTAKNKTNCTKQISAEENVCKTNKNNMLFVGCNGFF